MEIDRPIFVLGPHRSGTSLVYGLLARNAAVATFGPENNRLPRLPRLARATRRLRRRSQPHEAQRVWDLHWHGDDDRMDASDATPEVTRFYRRLVARVVRQRRAGRFLAKYPRLSLRVAWLDALFPDALYVHVVRDLRDVVSSTVVRKQAREASHGGFFGVRVPGWRALGARPHPEAAAEQFRLTTLALEAARAERKDRFTTVHYEALVSRPHEELTRIARFCDLTAIPAFTDAAAREVAIGPRRHSLDPELHARLCASDPAFFARYEVD